MNTKAFFPCGGGSNLILGIGRENQIFFLRTPAAVKFFHKIEPFDLILIIIHITYCIVIAYCVDKFLDCFHK